MRRWRICLRVIDYLDCGGERKIKVDRGKRGGKGIRQAGRRKGN